MSSRRSSRLAPLAEDQKDSEGTMIAKTSTTTAKATRSGRAPQKSPKTPRETRATRGSLKAKETPATEPKKVTSMSSKMVDETSPGRRKSLRSVQKKSPPPEAVGLRSELEQKTNKQGSALTGDASQRRSSRRITATAMNKLDSKTTKSPPSKKRKVSDDTQTSAARKKRAKRDASQNSTEGQEERTYKVKRVIAGGDEETKVYEMRVLKRLVPHEKEEDLKEKVKKEYADLLKCSESLVANRANGVNVQIAASNAAWEERFLDLLVFKKAHGHLLVPKVYLENKALGRWVAKVRRWKRSQDKRLTRSRLKRLEAAGFVWDAKADPNFWRIQNQCEQATDVWETRFKELMDYKKKTGDCMVPKHYPDNQKLARWVTKQRKHYRAKQENKYHTLDDEKEKRLKKEGFVFNTKTASLIRDTVLKRFEKRWEQFYVKLAAFKKKHGHCAVPRRWKKDQQLASWVMRQRFHWKKMKQGEHSYMTEERLQRLKEIGFAFVVDRRNDSVIDNEEEAAELLLEEEHQPARAQGKKKAPSVAAKAKAREDENDDDEEEAVEAMEVDAADDDGVDEFDDDSDDDSGEDVDSDDEIIRVKGESRPSSEDTDDSDTELLDTEDELEDDQDSDDESKAPAKLPSKRRDEENKDVVTRKSLEKTVRIDKATRKPAATKISAAKDESMSSKDKRQLKEEPAKHDAVALESDVGETPLQELQKGVWTCRVCSKDEFRNYVEAIAHEAECCGLLDLRIPRETLLE